jgi:hypothetical protein
MFDFYHKTEKMPFVTAKLRFLSVNLSINTENLPVDFLTKML